MSTCKVNGSASLSSFYLLKILTLHVLQLMSDLDWMIELGWGEVPQELIPRDWRERG